MKHKMEINRILPIAGIIIALAALFFALTTTAYAETKTITVNVDGSGNFTTITDALASITTTPASEADRVTIEVYPGTYREQLVVDKPYITLKGVGNSPKDVNITWYYATNYCYDNCGTNGAYDPNVDWSDPKTWKYDENSEQLTVYNTGDAVSTISYYDKNGVLHENVSVAEGHLGGVSNWGSTIRVTSGGKYFVTENIYYSSTLNLYVTQEELDAHVTPAAGSKQPVRINLSVCNEDTAEITVSEFSAAANYDAGQSAYLVRSKNFVERGAAFNCKSTNVTINNCIMRSNQDTFYCGGTNVYVYDCNIYGGTDYIFGEANAVFNNCNLYFEGYSDNEDGGVITAGSTAASSKYGYLFFECTILNARTNTTKGNLGRPWSSDAQVTFYNCTVKNNSNGELCINDVPWSDMSASKREEARFYTYGTKDENGNSIDASGGILNTKAEYGIALNDYQILPYNPRNYLSGWDPMGFGNTYLNDVDSALDNASVEIPAGASTEVELPQTPDGIEYTWVSASENAKVSEDGTKLIVLRPAYGEDDISSTVALYAMDQENSYGDMKTIDVTIGATTDTENVFTTQGTITLSVAPVSPVDFSIKFYKNNALIKTVTATAQAGETSVDYTADNIPPGEYDVIITADLESGYTIISPADGVSTVSASNIGDTITLDVTAQQIVDDTVDLGINYASSGSTEMTVYDLIALAKTAGADSSIDKSDIITVDYTVDVKSALASYAYIDLLSATPNSTIATSGVNSRFVLAKLNSSWKQIDMVDSVQGFSGSSNNEDQWLNISGNFDYRTPSKVSVTIDYRNKVITVKGSGISEEQSYTFGAFPSSYSKGVLNMAVYPTDNGSTNDFEISDISVTYKKIVSDPNATPAPTAVSKLEWIANNTSDGYSVTTDDNGITTFNVTAGTSVGGAGWYTDLSSMLDGYNYTELDKLTFTYKFMIEKAYGDGGGNSEEITYMPSYDGYIDLSSSTDYVYSGTDATRLSRYDIYKGWNQFNYFGATDTRVNGGLKFGEHEGEWYTLVTTVDLTNKTLSTTTVVGSTSATYDVDAENFATGLVNGKLYLNVIPTRVSNDANNIKFSIKDIDVQYTLPDSDYGWIRTYDDGSKKLYFGSNSITTYSGNTEANIASDTDDGMSIKRPDSVKANSDDLVVLTLPEIDLSSSDFDKVTICAAMPNNPTKVTVKVGDTVVGVIENIKTSSWSDYAEFSASLDTSQASGNVTLEITGAGASQYAGNYRYLKFSKSNRIDGVAYFPVSEGKIHASNQAADGGDKSPLNSNVVVTFDENVNADIKALFADPTDTAKVNSVYTSQYINYIGTGGASPYVNGFDLDKGIYRVYFLGCDNDVSKSVTLTGSNLAEDITVTIDANTNAFDIGDYITKDNGLQKLRAYVFDLTVPNDVTDAKISFNSVNASWLPDLCTVAIVKNPEFGETATDSGWYTNAQSAKVGVIRFLQAWNGEVVDEYGFYFMDFDGNILQSSRIFNTEDGDALNGFYGDLINIPENETSEEKPVYAKAYVKIDGVTYLSGDTISGWVDWDTQVIYE